MENPLYFYAERKIEAKELPASLGDFSELYKISYIIEYLGGGIKIYLADGTKEEEVILLAKKLVLKWKSISI